MSFYSSPIYGRAFKFFSRETISINEKNHGQFKYKEVVQWNKHPYAVFEDQTTKQRVMQSLRSIKFVRCKPGEDNINSKLSNQQTIDIFVRANEGADLKTLATEFNVAEGTISAIKNLRARASITMAYMNGKDPTKKQEKVAAIVATRNDNKKLSPSLANFIRRDKETMLLSTKSLANKYCVSTRTVQKILKNEMYRK